MLGADDLELIHTFVSCAPARLAGPSDFDRPTVSVIGAAVTAGTAVTAAAAAAAAAVPQTIVSKCLRNLT